MVNTNVDFIVNIINRVICEFQIYYRIKEVGEDHEKFSIDRQTGLIRTVSSFDREKKNEYYVTVVAEDGAPSDRPNHYPPGTPNQGNNTKESRFFNSLKKNNV